MGPLRLDDSAATTLRRAGQPSRRSGRSYRYCVQGARNEGSRVAAVFTGGSLGLIATDAPGYRAHGVSPGDPARLLSGTTRLGDGLRIDRTPRGTAFVYRVRSGEVRAVGVATASVAESAQNLRRDLAEAF